MKTCVERYKISSPPSCAIKERLDALERKLDIQIADLGRQIEDSSVSVNHRLDDLKQYLEKRFDSLEYQLRISERLSVVEEKLKERTN